VSQDLVDGWFLDNIDLIERVVLSRVEQASTEAELNEIEADEAPEGFRRLSALFKGRLREEANARIAAANQRVKAAIALKAAEFK
jgi:hypothetical protein